MSGPGPYWIVIHSGETCEGVVCQSRIQKHQNGNFSKSAFKATFKVVFGVEAEVVTNMLTLLSIQEKAEDAPKKALENTLYSFHHSSTSWLVSEIQHRT